MFLTYFRNIAKAAAIVLQRPGIARTIGLGLAVMASSLLLVSALSLVDLFRFQKVLSELSHTALPQVTLSARLSSLLNQLLYQTERLSSAYSHPDRRIAYEAIEYQFKLIQETSSWIEFGDAGGGPEKQLDTLKDTLSLLNNLVYKRIDAEYKANNALALLLKVYKEIMHFALEPHSSPSNTHNIADWTNAAAQCIELAGRAEKLNRLHKLERLRRELENQFQKLHEKAANISGKEHEEVLQLEKRLQGALLGRDGLFSLLADRITISGRNLGKGNFARSLVEEVNDLGAGLFLKFNSKAAKEAALLSQRVHREAWLQFLLAMVACIAAACVLLYFRKVLITRLIRLNEAVLDRVAGTRTPIQDSGNDEIAKIAHSINYFTSELSKAKELAENASDAKSKFLADMSHEIRTPLSTILGMAYLTSRTDLTGKQLEYITKLDGAARHLLGIIDNILDFSKIEAGKMELESIDFDLEDLLLEVADIAAPQAEIKGLELLVSLPAAVPRNVVGDPLRLRQSLINLVGNAVKFTKSGEIELSVALLHERAGSASLLFSVRDTGIGFSENELTRLFQSFQQADSSITRRFGGSGLGLTITRNLIDLMGGVLDVESVPNNGTQFFFELSFMLGDTGPAVFQGTDSLPSGFEVLVVDDNFSACKIFQKMLEDLELSYMITDSVSSVLELLQERSGVGDVVIMLDSTLIKRGNIEIIKQVSTMSGSHNKIKILRTGGVLQLQEGDDAFAMLFDGYLYKPVTLRRLLSGLCGAFDVVSKTVSEVRMLNSIPQQALKSLAGARVLLVEDQIVNREMTKEILERAYLSVEAVENGQEAVQRVLSGPGFYDLVLMDIQMPEMDGYEASQRIRKEISSNELPIIALTAHAIVGEREKCLAVGMNDYLTKPIDVGVLFQLLERWIQTDSTSNVPKNITPQPAPQRSGTLPSSLPGLEVERGLERILGNEQVYWKMLSLFIQENATSLQDIQQAIREGNEKAAILHVHALKGVAANISAPRLSAAAGELENAVKNKFSDADSLFKKLENEFNVVILSINKLGIISSD